MSRRRLVLCAATVLALAVSGPAGAAGKPKPKPKPKPPKPVCNMVLDPANDTETGKNAPAAYDPALDVVSADLVTDGTTITVAIRVAGLTSPLAPEGRYYEAKFWYVGSPYVYAFQAYVGPVQPVEPYADFFSPVVVDSARNEIRITEQAAKITGAPKLRRGMVIEHLFVGTDQGDPALPVPPTFKVLGDQAGSQRNVAGPPSKPYTVGAPSCVKLGS